MSSEIFEKCRRGVLTSCNSLRNPLSVLLYSTVFCMLATGVWAESITCPENTPSGTSCYQYTCGSNCTATLIGGAMTISGSGAMTNYSTTNMPWKEQIGSITSLTVKDGISNIGNNAFAYASSLKSVSLPNTMTNLGNYTFMSASSLDTINIPTAVTAFGNGLFAGTGFTSFEVPSQITTIGKVAFKNTQSLTEVTFAENSQLTTIEQEAFYNDRNLKEIHFPASLKSIGNSAFAVSGLELIDLSQATNLESIGRIAFASDIQNRIAILPDADFTLFGWEDDPNEEYYTFGGAYCPTPGSGNCYCRSTSTFTQIYCAKGQEQGACDKSKLSKGSYTKSTLAYEQYGDHYNVYDKNGKLVSSYGKLSDIGTDKKFKRTSYTPAEAAQSLEHTNKNEIIFTFK